MNASSEAKDEKRGTCDEKNVMKGGDEGKWEKRKKKKRKSLK